MNISMIIFICACAVYRNSLYEYGMLNLLIHSKNTITDVIIEMLHYLNSCYLLLFAM